MSKKANKGKDRVDAMVKVMKDILEVEIDINFYKYVLTTDPPQHFKTICLDKLRVLLSEKYALDLQKDSGNKL